MKTITQLLIPIFLVIGNHLSAQTSFEVITKLPDSTIFGPTSRNISDIAMTNDGAFWVSYEPKVLGAPFFFRPGIGLFKFHNNTWSKYDTTNSAIPSQSINDLQVVGNDLWLATWKGLAKLSNGVFTVYNKSNSGLPSDTVYAVKTYQNQVLVATARGIGIMNGSNWTIHNKSNTALSSDMFTTLDVSSDGKIYAGSKQGLLMINGSNKQLFTKANSGLKTDEIIQVSVDKQNMVWLLTPQIDIGTMNYSPFYILEGTTISNQANLPSVTGSCAILSTNAIKPNHGAPFKNNMMVYPALNTVGQGLVSFLQINKYTSSHISTNLPNNSSYRLVEDPSKPGTIYCVQTLQVANRSIFKINLDEYQKFGYINTKHLDINNVSIPLSSSTDFGYNFTSYESTFIPKNTCKRPIGASSLWVGAMNGNNLHLATQTMRESGNDFNPGPVRKDTNFLKYDQLWKINRWDVENFKKNFADSSISRGYFTILTDFLTWPAHGDTTLGQAYLLAPFVDADSNGHYNPYKGDYPKIKGDQAVYAIFNDSIWLHMASQSAIIGLEVHRMAYAFTCDQINDLDSNAAINYTTFYHYRIFNRSARNYSNVKIGKWINADIGWYHDDAAGCNPKLDYGFVYNKNAVDTNRVGYGVAPPAISIALLKGPIENNIPVKSGAFVSYNNDYTNNGKPSNPIHFWNYMNGRWINGAPMLYGGTNDSTTFRFPGKHDRQNRPEWSMETEGAAPMNGYFVLSTEQFSMPAGSMRELDYAIVYSRTSDTLGWPAPIVNKLESDIKRVKHWFETNSFPTCLRVNVGNVKTAPDANQNHQIVLFPNPTNQQIKIDGLMEYSEYNVVDLSGKTLLKGAISNQTPIQVGGLPLGLYFIQIKNSKQLSTIKFIKQE